MSAMTKVFVVLDEVNFFRPVVPGSEVDFWNRHPTMEIPQALIHEYDAATRAMEAINEKIEQLYRVQENRQPWAEPPVPEHKLLGKA
jgi:acyl dehydratase